MKAKIAISLLMLIALMRYAGQTGKISNLNYLTN